MATFDDFLKIDIRVGVVVEALAFPEARKPSYKLKIDFGQELGVKQTSAKLTSRYTPESLVGRKVVAVVNFPPRQIGKFMSEVLVLGVPGNNHDDVVLLVPDDEVEVGGRVY